MKADSRIILGMIMLEDNSPFKMELFLEDIKDTCEYKVGKPSGDENATTLNIDGELVAIGSIPAPIPMGDIEGTAKYAYNRDNALEEVNEHKAHLIVSVMQGSDNMVKRYKIFTSVICSLLRTNNAIGVYKGNQSLLIRKDDYLQVSFSAVPRVPFRICCPAQIYHKYQGEKPSYRSQQRELSPWRHRFFPCPWKQ